MPVMPNRIGYVDVDRVQDERLDAEERRLSAQLEAEEAMQRRQERLADRNAREQAQCSHRSSNGMYTVNRAGNGYICSRCNRRWDNDPEPERVNQLYSQANQINQYRQANSQLGQQANTQESFYGTGLGALGGGLGAYSPAVGYNVTFNSSLRPDTAEFLTPIVQTNMIKNHPIPERANEDLIEKISKATDDNVKLGWRTRDNNSWIEYRLWCSRCQAQELVKDTKIFKGSMNVADEIVIFCIKHRHDGGGNSGKVLSAFNAMDGPVMELISSNIIVSKSMGKTEPWSDEYLVYCTKCKVADRIEPVVNFERRPLEEMMDRMAAFCNKHVHDKPEAVSVNRKIREEDE